MPSGRYHVKVVVRENQNGTIGSYETDLMVPDMKSEAMKLSSVVVGTQLQAGARKNDRNPLSHDGRELVPNITHVVSGAASICTSITRCTIRRRRQAPRRRRSR